VGVLVPFGVAVPEPVTLRSRPWTSTSASGNSANLAFSNGGSCLRVSSYKLVTAGVAGDVVSVKLN